MVNLTDVSDSTRLSGYRPRPKARLHLRVRGGLPAMKARIWHPSCSACNLYRMTAPDPPTPVSRFSPRAGNLLLTLVSVFLAIGITEALMRRVYAGRPFSMGWVGQHQNRPSRNFVTDELPVGKCGRCVSSPGPQRKQTTPIAPMCKAFGMIPILLHPIRAGES